MKKMIRWLLTDFLIALLCVGIFLLHFYILPRKSGGEGTVLVDTGRETETGFALPDSADGKRETKRNPEKRENRRSMPGRGNPGNGNTHTSEIAADTEDVGLLAEMKKADTVLEQYRSDTLQLTITQSRLGEGEEQITYYTADFYLRSAEQLQTAFAEGTYGKNLRETTLEMAEENGALLAISGDSYGNNETGIVVRNGILYRSEENDAEICVLYYDGTMEIYTPEEFDQQKLLEKEVWQAWNFGPSLLENGEVKESFQTTSYLNKANPRCAIGYVEPGHYIFVVADGRDTGYSRGATMSELAQIMKEEGCRLAYNLDGGKSSAMVYQGEYVNQPADGGRTISDIIYIRKEDNDNAE